MARRALRRFTMIEMVVVVCVITLITTIVLVVARAGDGNENLEQHATQLRQILLDARRRAMRRGVESVVRFDLEAGGWRSETAPDEAEIALLALPEGAELWLDGVVADAESVAEFRFYPDGRAAAVRGWELRRADERLSIALSGLTGLLQTRYRGDAADPGGDLVDEAELEPIFKGDYDRRK